MDDYEGYNEVTALELYYWEIANDHFDVPDVYLGEGPDMYADCEYEDEHEAFVGPPEPMYYGETENDDIPF